MQIQQFQSIAMWLLKLINIQLNQRVGIKIVEVFPGLSLVYKNKVKWNRMEKGPSGNWSWFDLKSRA